MEYEDFAFLSPNEYEQLAKAYSNALKEKGFIFVRLDEEGVSNLVDETFDLMFKLRSTYRSLGTFMGSDKFYALNEEQIETMRKMFSYKQNRGFRLSPNKTKAFINAISLENRLVMKLFLLAQKSEEYERLVSLCFQRMRMSSDLYDVGEVISVTLK